MFVPQKHALNVRLYFVDFVMREVFDYKIKLHNIKDFMEKQSKVV